MNNFKNVYQKIAFGALALLLAVTIFIGGMMIADLTPQPIGNAQTIEGVFVDVDGDGAQDYIVNGVVIFQRPFGLTEPQTNK